MSEYATVDLLIEAIDEEVHGPLTSEAVELVRKGWVNGQKATESQLTTAQAENEALRARVAMLESEVVKVKEICAESLIRVIACWREDGVSVEHKNIADSFEGFLSNLPKTSAWLLRKQAEAVEAVNSQHGLCYALPDQVHGKRFASGFHEAQKLARKTVSDYAQRLRNRANEIDGGGQ